MRVQSCEPPKLSATARLAGFWFGFCLFGFGFFGWLLVFGGLFLLLGFGVLFGWWFVSIFFFFNNYQHYQIPEAKKYIYPNYIYSMF